MSFNSYLFLLFFPVVVSVYFVVPHTWRWLWLLIASSLFYMAFIPAYILILFLLIIIDYTAALLIEKSQGRERRALLLVSILSTCSVLFIFKYFDFLNNSAAYLSHYFGWVHPIKNLSLILPLGLSFHTFQSLGYVIEVYRGKHKAERHLGIYALYVMFFPQLVAGPIERAGHMLPQFFVKHDFDARRMSDGLKLMVWGMFQKVVIADRLALLVNKVYGDPAAYSGPALIIATVFFAFQIYCDFSGYSDIAIGGAKVLGFDLMKNFERPYLASSVADFWHRWHISLSTWFRDYLYIPLGGNKVSPGRWRFNIFVTFLVSGLWHGANWTFVVWGALHGFYYLFGQATRALREKIAAPHAVKIMITFALVCFAWIFFRASSLNDAGIIIAHLGSGWGSALNFGTGTDASLGLSFYGFLGAIVLIIFLIGIHLSEQTENICARLSKGPVILRWTVYAVIGLTIMNLGIAAPVPFIYFQF